MSKYYLVLDTSAEVCKIGLLNVENETYELIGLSTFVFTPAHGLAEEIEQRVTDVLIAKNINYQDLTGALCSIGPGSFTGLRTGLAFLYGVCLGRGIELITCSSFFATAIFKLHTDKLETTNLILRANRQEYFSICIDKTDVLENVSYEIHDIEVLDYSVNPPIDGSFDIELFEVGDLMKSYWHAIYLLKNLSNNFDLGVFNGHLNIWMSGPLDVVPLYIKKASALTLLERGVKSSIDPLASLM